MILQTYCINNKQQTTNNKQTKQTEAMELSKFKTEQKKQNSSNQP
jgi:hypothetical protein